MLTKIPYNAFKMWSSNFTQAFMWLSPVSSSELERSSSCVGSGEKALALGGTLLSPDL